MAQQESDILVATFLPDIPNGFKPLDAQGTEHDAGAYLLTVKHFAERHNFALHFDYPEDGFVVTQVQNAMQEGNLNTSILPVAYGTRFANVSFSYPTEWESICIMVPAEDELPRYWYVVWPFDLPIWIVLMVSVVYVAVLMRFLKHPTAKFSLNLLTSLAVIIGSSNMNLDEVNAHWRIQLFYFNLFVMGFILSSFYNSYYAAYSMRPIFQPFIRTMDDILRAQIELWTPGNLIQEVAYNKPEMIVPILDLIQIEPGNEIAIRQSEQVRTSAYFVRLNEWKLTKVLQRTQIQPTYKLSDVCFGYQLYSFPIQVESKFASDLDYFIMLVQQQGLWQHWEAMAYEWAIWSKTFKVYEDEYPLEPLDMDSFRIDWIILVGGIMASCICFLMECVVYKCKMWRK